MAGRGFLAWLSCEGYGRMRREYTPRRRSGDLVVVGGGQGERHQEYQHVYVYP
jgi:hypothetical protein